jgi:hypothetical protein
LLTSLAPTPLKPRIERNDQVKRSRPRLYAFCMLSKSFQPLQANNVQVLGPPALAAACLQLSPSMVPLPLPPTRESLFILTGIFWVTMKILYLIRGALPEIHWWWRIMKAPVKKVNLRDVGNRLSVCCTLCRHLRTQHNEIDDSRTQDV